MRAQRRFGVAVLGIVAAILLAGAERAGAALITFNYTAQVVEAINPFGLTVNTGDIETGSFSWDTSATPFLSSSTVAGYELPVPPASFVLNLTDDGTGQIHTVSTVNPGGLVVAIQSGTTPSIIAAEAEDSTFTVPEFSFDNGPPLSGGFEFGLANLSQDVLGGNLSLPSSINLAQFPDLSELIVEADDSAIELQFLSITSVPEPSSLALFGLGVGAVLGYVRRRRRAHRSGE